MRAWDCEDSGAMLCTQTMGPKPYAVRVGSSMRSPMCGSMRVVPGLVNDIFGSADPDTTL